MNTSTHYELKLVEGTDLVNPLTVDVPNYQAIDTAMFANEQAGVGTATELKSGTIHAITRANQNRNVFTFKSTSVFNVGDTFTVDGSTVTALYPDNSSLKERCFIVGSQVMCMLDGSQLTVLATYYPEASNVVFDNSDTDLSATDVQSAIEELTNSDNIQYNSTDSVKDALDVLTETATTTINGTYLNTPWYIRKSGNIVLLSAKEIKDIPAGASSMTGIIPEKYRPVVEFQYTTLNKNNSTQILITVYNNGDIRFYNYGTAVSGGAAIYDTLVWTTI